MIKKKHISLVFRNLCVRGVKEEFNKASSGLTKAVDSSSTEVSSPLRTRDRWKRDKALSDIAKKLNITTEGKTNEQITREIIEKIESKKDNASKAVKR